MMVTFQSFKRSIFEMVFPENMAEQRVPLFRNFVVNGLIQLSTYVESYQLVNVGFYDKDQSWDDCGLSIIQGCRGRVGAVYSFKPSCRCQRYFFEPASLEKISCMYESCRCGQPGCGCTSSPVVSSSICQTSVYLPDPDYCGYRVGGNEGCTPPYLAAQPEDDCAFIRTDRYFAIGPSNKIWLYPRYPCGHVVAVHWTGIRRNYLDTDYVFDDEDLKDAVACYVESEVARRVDKDHATADRLYANYRMKAGDIIFREEQDLKPRATRVCVDGLDQSELVQIYPDNLYPVSVGESCALSTGVGTGSETEPEPFSDTDHLFWWALEEESGDRLDELQSVPLTPNNEIHMTVDTAKVGDGVHFVSTVNSNVIIQSANSTVLAYAGAGFDCMFWLKVNSYGASTQILVPRLRFYNSSDVQLASFTFNATSASVALVSASNNGDSLSLTAPTIPQTGQWYFIRAFYDPADNKVGIQIDNGTVEKSASGFTSAMPNAAKVNCGIWHFGSGGGSLDDFIVDELVLKMDGLFTEDEVDLYWNEGNGRTWPIT